MALLVLFTSSGFGLVEHSCRLNGKKSYSFVQKKACCAEKKHQKAGKTSISKSKCCESKELKPDQSPQEKSTDSIAQKVIKAANEAVMHGAQIVLQHVIAFISSHFVVDDDSGPSPSGASIVISLHKLRL